VDNDGQRLVLCAPSDDDRGGGVGLGRGALCLFLLRLGVRSSSGGLATRAAAATEEVVVVVVEEEEESDVLRVIRRELRRETRNACVGLGWGEEGRSGVAPGEEGRGRTHSAGD